MPQMNIWLTETDKASVHCCENVASIAPYIPKTIIIFQDRIHRIVSRTGKVVTAISLPAIYVRVL